MIISIPALVASDSPTDVWEHWSFVATVFAAIFTAIWAVRERSREFQWRRQDQQKEAETRRAELEQRAQELRWKQAELARTMMDAIFDYAPSNDAWRMVDGEQQYEDGGQKYQIDMNLVRASLPEQWSKDCGGPEVYVRWCFDALFYYLEQLEQSLRLGILRFEDLESAASYYVALMAKDKSLFETYSKLIRFQRALEFMNRFSEWRESKA